MTRAGIKPAAAAPSQPTRLDVSRSDHSAASKRNGFVTSFKATVRTDTVDGVGQREKEGKEARKREQPGQTGARERRKAAEKR